MLERQLHAREAEMVEYTLRKEKETKLVGAVLSSLRKKIDTVGYNIAVRSNLPFPPPKVLQRSPNGQKEGADPPSPLQQYITGTSSHNHQYTAKQMLAWDQNRDQFLSQFDNDDEEEESHYEGNDDDDIGEEREAALRSSYDEGDGESVDLKNQLLARYDEEMLRDEELSQLEANDASILAGETGAGEVVMGGYEELDGMESEEERDPLGDNLGEGEKNEKSADGSVTIAAADDAAGGGEVDDGGEGVITDDVAVSTVSAEEASAVSVELIET